MRILVITSGCDRSEKALYQGLVNAGIDVDLLCDPETPYQKELIRSGVCIEYQRVRNRIDWKAIRAIRQRLKAVSYDIVYSPRNHSLSVSLLAARGLQVKHVAYRGTSGHLSRLDPASRLTYLNPRIDKIICVSHAVRRYLMTKGVPSHRLVTIYKGHDIRWYRNPSSANPAQFGIPPNAFIVGFIGNMRPVKGVGILLEAMEHIPDDLPIHLLLVGKVQDRRVEKRCKRFDDSKACPPCGLYSQSGDHGATFRCVCHAVH